MARLKIEFQSTSTGGPKTYENELYELGTWCTAVHSRIGSHFIWPAGFFESTQNLLRTLYRDAAFCRGPGSFSYTGAFLTNRNPFPRLWCRGNPLAFCSLSYGTGISILSYGNTGTDVKTQRGALPRIMTPSNKPWSAMVSHSYANGERMSAVMLGPLGGKLVSSISACQPWHLSISGGFPGRSWAK